MKAILKLFAGLLALALLLGGAWYLDKAVAKRNSQAIEQSGTEAQPELVLPQVTEPLEMESAETEPAETEPAETEPREERFLLTFAGDCTLGSRPSHSYIELGFAKTIGDDYGFPFRNVLEYFENDELTCINLEGALTDVGNPADKKHTFRGPTAYVEILTQNSVDFVSLANNHTLDYGQRGYNSTVSVLEAAGVPYVERDSSTLLTTPNGLRVGIYGAVYYLLDTEVITSAIRELREQADIVIFAPHWGNETSLKYSKKQQELAHAVIDAGADIIWGSHTHVLQEVEFYNGGIIYYSMGNFSFGGNIYPDDYDSALIQQEVIRAADGTITLGETIPIPVRISSDEKRNNYQPTPYEEGSEDYVRVLEKLGLGEKN